MLPPTLSFIQLASRVLANWSIVPVYVCTQVFQCLLIEGENCGSDALRDAEKFVISDEEFGCFLERHSTLSCLVPESNEKVKLRIDKCNKLRWNMCLGRPNEFRIIQHVCWISSGLSPRWTGWPNNFNTSIQHNSTCVLNAFAHPAGGCRIMFKPTTTTSTTKHKNANKNLPYTINLKDLLQPQNAKLDLMPLKMIRSLCSCFDHRWGKTTPSETIKAHSGTRFGPLVPALPLLVAPQNGPGDKTQLLNLLVSLRKDKISEKSTL